MHAQSPSVARRIVAPLLLGLLASMPADAQAPASATAHPAPAATPQGPGVAVGAPDWLTGCWQFERGALVVEEHWMPPRGGMAIAMSRTSLRDSVREWEFVVLAVVDGRLAYQAHPSGQAGGVFPLMASTDSSLVFENPAHDFPTRILYRRVGRDSLDARIEGSVGGTARAFDFPYRRVPCP